MNQLKMPILPNTNNKTKIINNQSLYPVGRPGKSTGENDCFVGINLVLSPSTSHFNIVLMQTQLVKNLKVESWAKLSADITVRDKSVRVLEYGSTMLLGYYSSQLCAETELALKNTNTFSSAARKLFRLLKSIESIRQMIKLFQCVSVSPADNLLNRLEIITQAFWAIFYYYDNQLILARTRVISQDPDIPNSRSNIAWFAADTFNLLSCTVNLLFFCQKRCVIIDKMGKLEGGSISTVARGYTRLCCIFAETVTFFLGLAMPSSFETTHETTIKEDLARLQCQLDQLGPEKRNALLWFLLKAVFDVGVSGGMEPIFLGKRLGFSNLSNGNIGLLAVCTSLMSLYEVWSDQNTVIDNEDD